MKFVNLTPHAIHLPGLTIDPSGEIARCEEITRKVGDADGIELIIRMYGKVTGLPEPEQGTWYIVSMLVRDALPDRLDIASPGDLVRDDTGKIVGAKNLIVNPGELAG